jgi:hypothetical protein
LPAGTYAVPDSFPVGVTFDLPAGWGECTAGDSEPAFCLESSVTAPTAVSFLIVDNVVADPCEPGGRLLEPPVGPSVDDLVTAISGLADFSATTPADVVVDGYRGREFTLSAPSKQGCDLKTWATADRTNGVGSAEINLIQVIDVDGTRLVITGAYHPADPAAAENLAALRSILASVHITSRSGTR